jgi:hypothetical protein
MWIGRSTDLSLFHSSRICLPLGGTSRVSVYKTRQCDVTMSVTGRVCSPALRHLYIKRIRLATEEGNVSPSTVKACRLYQFTSARLAVSKA